MDMPDLAGASTPADANVPAAVADNAVPQTGTAPEQQQPDKLDDQADKRFSQAELDEIVQKRLAKAERQWERRNRELLETALDRVGGSRTPVQEAKQSDDVAPDPQQFADYGEYLKAQARWEARQVVVSERKKIEQESRQRAEEKRMQELRSSFAKQVEAAQSKYADFEDVAFAPDVPISEAMSMAIAESDVGAELAYYFGRNRAEAARISAMSAFAAAREIGKLEARLHNPPPVQVSKAPEPIKPVGNRATVAKDPGKMTDEEYAKWRKSHR